MDVKTMIFILFLPSQNFQLAQASEVYVHWWMAKGHCFLRILWPSAINRNRNPINFIIRIKKTKFHLQIRFLF